MRYQQTTGYALSLPERIVRSLAGLIAGAAKEVGEVMLPLRVRRSRLYTAVIGLTLRFLLEQVAEIEKTSGETESALPSDFLMRRAAGDMVGLAGIAAFHASPVWVLAALSDLAGASRDLVAEIAGALQAAELLPPGQRFSSVNELLDGLESMAGQMAQAVTTPPLNVAEMRAEWRKICREAARIPHAVIPDRNLLWQQWNELKQEANRQHSTVLELSSVMAIAAVRKLPENARWLSSALRIGGQRTGEVVGHTLLDHYRDTLLEIQTVGYLNYWLREFRPYLKGAMRQFSTRRQSSTERLLSSVWPYKGSLR